MGARTEGSGESQGQGAEGERLRCVSSSAFSLLLKILPLQTALLLPLATLPLYGRVSEVWNGKRPDPES